MMIAGAVAAAMWGAGPVAVPGAGDAWALTAARGVAPAATSWGRAIEVPGIGTLNKGGHAIINEVSCASAGNCAAGGYYRDGQGHGQGFVAVERNGVWRKAIEVPGLAALNQGAGARVTSVSCASAGSCAAGGFYRDGQGHGQGFVAVERNGLWGRAIEVAGLGVLNAGGAAGVGSVSCGSAGNCAASGNYATGNGPVRGFVVSEKNGVWGQVIEVPGLRALGRKVFGLSVSCPSAGNCAAAGTYRDSHDRDLGFVVSDRNGVWGQAIRVPGIRDLGKGNGGVGAVSCASAGNCAVGGSYGEVHGTGYQGFVAVEKNGIWGRAIKVPGLGALVTGRSSAVDSMSCASPGNCAAGGVYEDQQLGQQGFVAVENNGVWGRAINVPGLSALNVDDNAGVRSVSCGSPGTCVAGGWYADLSGHHGRHLQGFVT
jgi:hypothetical protein